MVHVTELEWATVTLAMIGRFGITVAFFILYIVTVEIFPTTMRATVGSVCSTFGKMGGLVSPYIGKLVRHIFTCVCQAQIIGYLRHVFNFYVH